MTLADDFFQQGPLHTDVLYTATDATLHVRDELYTRFDSSFAASFRVMVDTHDRYIPQDMPSADENVSGLQTHQHANRSSAARILHSFNQRSFSTLV